jgi:hypothetical protein
MSCCGGGLLEVVEAQQARGGTLELGEGRGRLLEVPQLDRGHRPVPVLGHEGDVEDPHDAAVHQVQQQRRHLVGRGLPAGPLQDDVVDRAQLLELHFTHGPLLSSVHDPAIVTAAAWTRITRSG